LELVCSECGSPYGTIKPEEYNPGVRCSKCGGKLGVNPTPGVRIRRGKSKKMKTIFKRIAKTAELLEKYGRDAAIVLAGRGLSLKTVEKILLKSRVAGEDIVKMVVDAERRRFQNA